MTTATRQVDQVRAAVRTLAGEFSPSQVHALTPLLSRSTVRQICAGLVGTRELRLIRAGRGGSGQEAVYEATSELHRTPADLERTRAAAAALQRIYLKWGARRPTDNIGVLRASAD